MDSKKTSRVGSSLSETRDWSKSSVGHFSHFRPRKCTELAKLGLLHPAGFCSSKSKMVRKVSLFVDQKKNQDPVALNALRVWSFKLFFALNHHCNMFIELSDKSHMVITFVYQFGWSLCCLLLFVKERDYRFLGSQVLTCSHLSLREIQYLTRGQTPMAVAEKKRAVRS